MRAADEIVIGGSMPTARAAARAASNLAMVSASLILLTSGSSCGYRAMMWCSPPCCFTLASAASSGSPIGANSTVGPVSGKPEPSQPGAKVKVTWSAVSSRCPANDP